MKKGGTLSLSPKDSPSVPRPGDTYEDEAPQKDRVVPPRGLRATTPDDYVHPEYDYGDKLPKNRGVPIPMSPDETKQDTAKKTTSTDKHSYKVRWS